MINTWLPYLQPLVPHEPKVEIDPSEICPECKERKKHVTDSGNKRGYCLPCGRAVSLEQMRDHRERKATANFTKPDTRRGEKRVWHPPTDTCPSCKINKKHITKSGNEQSYCLLCTREYVRIYQRKRRAGKIKHEVKPGGKRRGRPPIEDDANLCPKCKGANKVVSASGRRQAYCLACHRIEALKSKEKRRAESE